MKQFVLTICILFQLKGMAQTTSSENPFNHKILEVSGDLNKDGLPDKAVVTQDTLSDTSPYRLQVFFKEPTGQFKLMVTSTKIIEAEFPDGRDGYRNGSEFDNVVIKNGVLTVNFQLLRGHYAHKFRFQHGNFELIGFTGAFSNGQGVFETVDFNLVTGLRIETSERYDIDKIISKERKKIVISPLPKLQDVVPMKSEYY